MHEQDCCEEVLAAVTAIKDALQVDSRLLVLGNHVVAANLVESKLVLRSLVASKS